MKRATRATLVVLATMTVAAASRAAEPLRLSATIDGQRAVIEVRDQSRQRAEESIRSALMVITETLQHFDAENPDSAVARLNVSAGQGAQPIDRILLALLQKSLGFCVWSQRAIGPLGGVLFQSWETASQVPTADALKEPLQAASCQNLEIRPDTLQASLASGCRIDLRHFAAGFAVDRAVDRLRESGAENLWVEFGSVVRAVGPGADARGWRYRLPVFAGMSEGLEPILLRDMSVAAVSAHRERFRIGDLDYSPFLDQRSGYPAGGVVGVVLATPLAVDAQAIGTAMMILGNREGQLRLANVKPAPAALWLLGDGSGEPLLTTYRWSALGSP